MLANENALSTGVQTSDNDPALAPLDASKGSPLSSPLIDPTDDLPPSTPASIAASAKMMTVKAAMAIAGTLTYTTKMPGPSYDLDPIWCPTGSKLAKIPGTECSICYASRGWGLTRAVKEARERRRQSLTHPLWEDALVTMIEAYIKNRPQNLWYFRWHAAGDLQSLDHLKRIIRVCERVPEMNFWIQTRELPFISQFLNEGGSVPENLTVRISSTEIGVAR